MSGLSDAGCDDSTAPPHALESDDAFVAERGGHNYWKRHKFYAQQLDAVEAFLDGTLRDG